MKHSTITIIAIATTIFLSMCGQGEENSSTEASVPEETVWGIDISHHQGIIKWDRMNSRRPDFIFMKATEGSTFTDPRFKEYRAEAKKLGIPVGAYHFFSYRSSGESQANHFLKTVKDQELELPLVIDLEFSRKMLPAYKLRQEIRNFVNVVKKSTGKAPMFYGECGYYERYVKGWSVVPYLWISSMEGPPICDHNFWQKTERFSHPSFVGRIDYNEFNGLREELLTLN